MKVKRKRVEAVKAWGWEFDGGLCFWTLPTRKAIVADGKPSPEAKPVQVRIIRESDYRRLLRAARRGR